MKFQPDTPDGVNSVSRHDPGCVWVGATRFGHSVVVPRSGAVEDWSAARFEDLTEAHFERLLSHRPELVIFGSGGRIRFPPPALLRSLIEQRIGVECMDTPAACRTFNVLVSEGRAVLAALVVEPGGVRTVRPPGEDGKA